MVPQPPLSMSCQWVIYSFFKENCADMKIEGHSQLDRYTLIIAVTHSVRSLEIVWRIQDGIGSGKQLVSCFIAISITTYLSALNLWHWLTLWVRVRSTKDGWLADSWMPVTFWVKCVLGSLVKQKRGGEEVKIRWGGLSKEGKLRCTVQKSMH